MTNDEIFPVYAALWGRLPVEDLWIHYVGPTPRGEAGYFQHDGQGGFKRPEIGVLRSHFVEPDDEPSMLRSNGVRVNLVTEMFTLAHEFGHYLSYAGVTPPETWHAYHRAVVHRDELGDAIDNELSRRDRLRKRLSGRERRLIVAEETRAWALGREFIPEPVLAAYERRARQGVHFHRYRLGIDPLWPQDNRVQDSVE
jgi:hypothetical protein